MEYAIASNGEMMQMRSKAQQDHFLVVLVLLMLLILQLIFSTPMITMVQGESLIYQVMALKMLAQMMV
ncbi:hypothetical protein FJSC11DRAFT_2478 [Fischerella thermalis JSC-11]|jgi:hypothetical protein|uniref:Uncharacterized protein n=1 Tax=Fischerella thermalis JSC-11 TaxID=741277 RepID=G6FUD1_9CYAN|nr:hypothetical protein [Fischerella thermalis]EHC12861.1 hypothetical protein FJSC11DRAFT_2478 [Fischerella thermalis JSC-11]